MNAACDFAPVVDLRTRREWMPPSRVRPGCLQPCGSNPSGTVREFFAHPDDVAALLGGGLVLRTHGIQVRYRCELVSEKNGGWPNGVMPNGDVQVRAVLEQA